MLGSPATPYFDVSIVKRGTNTAFNTLEEAGRLRLDSVNQLLVLAINSTLVAYLPPLNLCLQL